MADRNMTDMRQRYPLKRNRQEEWIFLPVPAFGINPVPRILYSENTSVLPAAGLQDNTPLSDGRSRI
jgi:hypothetical protein